MTKTSWKRFLLLHLPGAALVSILAVQAVAFALSDVPMWRARFDEVALATLKDPTRYRILLFGDSVTSMATGRFSLGAPGEVGNLSTHGGIALPGSLFMLQRYLSTHPSPDYVVLTFAPAVYHAPKSLRVARYNLWDAYRLPDERDFLRTYFPGIGWRDWLPAVFDLQERVVEPFSSFLVQRKQQPRMDIGSLTADPDAPVEMAERADTTDVAAFSDMRDTAFTDMRDTSLSAASAEALSRICDLGRKHGFRIELTWPPLPAYLEETLTSNGSMAELEGKIRSIMEGRCDVAAFTNFARIRHYPNLSFRNDLTHLHGYGWEQRYTADMIRYLHGLLHPAPEEVLVPVIGGHAIESAGMGRSLPERAEASPDAAPR
jgi:hypothetical protein